MEVLTKQEALQIFDGLKNLIEKQNQKIESLEQQVLGQSKIIKMKDVRKILNMSWEEVKYRMEKGIIQYQNKGNHYIFDSAHIHHLAKNPELLRLREEATYNKHALL